MTFRYRARRSTLPDLPAGVTAAEANARLAEIAAQIAALEAEAKPLRRALLRVARLACVPVPLSPETVAECEAVLAVPHVPFRTLWSVPE